MDAWRAPKRIFDAHPPDQYAQLCLDLRSPSQWARLPTPVAAKAGPMPTHERLGTDDCENLQDRWKPAIQLDKEPAIIVREPDATMQPTLQDNQLMSKHRVLSFKPQLRLEWRGQDGQNETEQPDHSASLGDSTASSTQIRFSVHTGKLRYGKRPRRSRCRLCSRARNQSAGKPRAPSRMRLRRSRASSRSSRMVPTTQSGAIFNTGNALKEKAGLCNPRDVRLWSPPHWKRGACDSSRHFSHRVAPASRFGVRRSDHLCAVISRLHGSPESRTRASRLGRQCLVR